jgi:uncharacterized protein
MTTWFMDTSAIIKRYVTEIGSGWVTSLVQPTSLHIIVLSALTSVESFSTLARLQRSKHLTPAIVTQRQNDLLVDIKKQYLLVSLSDAVLVRAATLVNKHPLRTLDSIQLSCAIEAQAMLGVVLIFLSADNNLLSAAAAEGLATDNPLNHP